MVDASDGLHSDGEGSVLGVEGDDERGLFGAVGDERGEHLVGALGVLDACPVVEGCRVEFSGEIDITGEGVVGVLVALVVVGGGWHCVPYRCSGRLVPGRCVYVRARVSFRQGLVNAARPRALGERSGPRTGSEGAYGSGAGSVSDCGVLVWVGVVVGEAVGGVAFDGVESFGGVGDGVEIVVFEGVDGVKAGREDLA